MLCRGGYGSTSFSASSAASTMVGCKKTLLDSSRTTKENPSSMAEVHRTFGQDFPKVFDPRVENQRDRASLPHIACGSQTGFGARSLSFSTQGLRTSFAHAQKNSGDWLYLLVQGEERRISRRGCCPLLASRRRSLGCAASYLKMVLEECSRTGTLLFDRDGTP